MAAYIPNDKEEGSKRLVLCFDGTGNKFLGTEVDTNIVKIYCMLDRASKDQFHYYQPGIGTYAQNQTTNSATPRGIFSRLKVSLSSALDQAVGTSFVYHVLAGYRFLMRYYSPGDRIYVFGFSRGAYTARFLAEMVRDIGLLSKGNEEMVHFAWATFSAYQTSEYNSVDEKHKRAYMNQFKDTFCRPGVETHFLGLFDCVNSVGQFEVPFFRNSSPYIPPNPATHIRHAVSISERRLKFKPALFMLNDETEHQGTLEELWFPGNHGDVGGGWQPEENKRLLSDLALKWMIEEVEGLDVGGDGLAFDTNEKKKILNEDTEAPLEFNEPHDMLAFGLGAGPLGVIGWWMIETLPFFARLELEDKKWVARNWPPNLGARRDIPDGARFSQDQNLLIEKNYLRKQQIGGERSSDSLLSSFIRRIATPALFLSGFIAIGFGVWRGSLL